MRIFNNRGSNLELPLGNGQKISVLPYSVSADFLPSTNFLVMLASTFDFKDLSIIVNGIQEINACSNVSTCNGFVVYSVSEAVERMNKIKEEKEQTPVNPAATTTKEEQNEEVKEFNKKKSKKKETEED
jgi:hypothetical protein